jgi:hypothetical protein
VREGDALFKSWKSRAAVFVVAATMAVPALGTANAGAAGATKVTWLEYLIIECDTLQAGGAVPTDHGSVVFNATPDGKVAATAQLRDMLPNKAYNVQLIQGNANCDGPFASITTNKQGNATVHLSAPSTSSVAVVRVIDPLVSSPLVTPVFNH